MDRGTIKYREVDQPWYPRLNIGLDAGVSYVYSGLLFHDVEWAAN